MYVSKVNFNIDVSEEDLKQALEYWLKNVHNVNTEITHIKHLVGERTEGSGYWSIDVPYQEGLKLTCTDKA